MRKKLILGAVYNEEIEDFLQEIGLLNEIIEGNIKCETCGAYITVNNLLAIAPLPDKKYMLICDKSTCMDIYSRNSS